MCSVTGAVSINPTINYQWFKTAPRRIEVGANSPILTFDTLVLSNAGQYSCEVTVSSSLLSQAATVVSRDYNLRFPSKSKVRILTQSLFIIYKLIIYLSIHIHFSIQLSTFNFGSMEYLTVLNIPFLVQPRRQTSSPPDLYRVWRASVDVASVPHLSQIHS